MMALGLQLTAQPRCTLGCMKDGEREGRKTQRREGRRMRKDLGEKRGKEKVPEVVKEWERGIIGGGEGRLRVEGESEQEIEISRCDRRGRDSRGQTERVDGE